MSTQKKFTTSMGIAAATFAVVVGMTITGCSTQPEPPKQPVSMQFQTGPNEYIPEGNNQGSRFIDLGTSPVTLVAQGGEVSAVTVDGKSLEKKGGEFVLDPKAIGYGKSVQVVAEVQEDSGFRVDNGGKITTTVTAVKPDNLTMPSVETSKKIGNGSLVRVHWDEPIVNRKVAEESLVVTDPQGNPVPGGFRWMTDKDMQFRPKEFWKPNTVYTVSLNAWGKNFGSADKTLYGQDDVRTTIQTGDLWKVLIEDNKHTMTISKNDRVVRRVPVSNGKAGHETPNGLYVVGDEKNQTMIMDSSTYGVTSGPEAYKTPVNWATRISYSGIFVHGAPWSEAEQGVSNSSHGCINVTDAQAEWFMKHIPVGSIVEVRGSQGGTLDMSDGLGYWNGSVADFEKSGEA